MKENKNDKDWFVGMLLVLIVILGTFIVYNFYLKDKVDAIEVSMDWQCVEWKNETVDVIVIEQGLMCPDDYYLYSNFTDEGTYCIKYNVCIKEGKNCKEETSRVMEFVEFSRNDSCVNFRWEIHNSNYEYDLDYILDYGYSTKEAVEFNINNTQLGSSIRYWRQFNDLNITWKWVNEKNFTSVCRYGEWFKKEVTETVCEEYRDLK